MHVAEAKIGPWVKYASASSKVSKILKNFKKIFTSFLEKHVFEQIINALVILPLGYTSGFKIIIHFLYPSCQVIFLRREFLQLVHLVSSCPFFLVPDFHEHLHFLSFFFFLR